MADVPIPELLISGPQPFGIAELQSHAIEDTPWGSVLGEQALDLVHQLIEITTEHPFDRCRLDADERLQLLPFTFYEVEPPLTYSDHLDPTDFARRYNANSSWKISVEDIAYVLKCRLPHDLEYTLEALIDFLRKAPPDWEHWPQIVDLIEQHWPTRVGINLFTAYSRVLRSEADTLERRLRPRTKHPPALDPGGWTPRIDDHFPLVPFLETLPIMFGQIDGFDPADAFQDDATEEFVLKTADTLCTLHTDYGPRAQETRTLTLPRELSKVVWEVHPHYLDVLRPRRLLRRMKVALGKEPDCSEWELQEDLANRFRWSIMNTTSLILEYLQARTPRDWEKAPRFRGLFDKHWQSVPPWLRSDLMDTLVGIEGEAGLRYLREIAASAAPAVQADVARVHEEADRLMKKITTPEDDPNLN